MWGVYLRERDSGGNLVLEPPGEVGPADPRETFRRHCYLNGVTDPRAVDRLYRRWRDRLDEAAAADDGER